MGIPLGVGRGCSKMSERLLGDEEGSIPWLGTACNFGTGDEQGREEEGYQAFPQSGCVCGVDEVRHVQ